MFKDINVKIFKVVKFLDVKLNCLNILTVKSTKEIMNVIMGFISGVWTHKRIEFIKRCKTI